jgi:hypothetical protein
MSKFARLSYFSYQNMGKFFTQHLASQNFGMPKFWHQSKQALSHSKNLGESKNFKFDQIYTTK